VLIKPVKDISDITVSEVMKANTNHADPLYLLYIDGKNKLAVIITG